MRAFALTLLAVSAAAGANQAIVIGINHYQNPKPAQLEGPENDAADIADFCQRHGYTLPPSHLLLGRKATAGAIRAAWQDIQKSAQPGERVLFYFAGHGTNHGTAARPNCAILPYDFSPGKPESLIGVNELYAAIKAMPTKGNRTVILDSCFSGGMARDLEFRSRSFSEGTERSVVPVIPDDSQAHVGVPKETAPGDPNRICYLTAAKASEEALETDVGGKAHGLFTHALLPQLEKEGTCGQTSADTQATIAQFLKSKGSFRKQTPDVTDEYRNLQVLKETPNGEAPPPPPPPKSVWEMIAREHPDPTKVRLIATPGRGDLRLGQTIRFKVVVGTPGYLVVLWNKDTVAVESPALGPGQRRYRAAFVQPGEYDLSPEEGGQAFDQAGGNRVSAFLFTSKAPAQRLLDAFNAAPAASVDDLLQGQGLVGVAGLGEGGCYTSGLSFEVGAQILGGFEVTDAPGLCDALLKPGGPFEDEFTNRVERESLRRLGAARAGKADPRRFAEFLTMCVNMTLESLASGKKPRSWIDPDAAPSAQREAVRDADRKIATADHDQATAINAGVLARLLPQYVRAVSP